jgi:hypothetical protein
MYKASSRGSVRTYSMVHTWLYRNFTPPKACTGSSCTGTSKMFTWALKRGCVYEKNIENFIALCRSCHSKYDMTEETIVKIVRKRLSRKSCRRGHTYTADSVYKSNGQSQARVCRICRRFVKNRRRAERKKLGLPRQ